ncbi:MAG TPA: DUF1223 domain-containing protein [Chryseolinea sp.]|nr:DUF1223 domain-containing protein [Chryseolinea sp.]
MILIKKLVVITFLVFAGFIATTNLFFISRPVDPGAFAVVELFTSEGCSSCPPADALVAKIQKQEELQRVYILSYHVDYWDRLGWKDPFSSADYSARQKQYASWLNLKSVYTPQIVVNGRNQFVGSDEETLRTAIKKGLASPGEHQLSLVDLKLENDKLKFQYHKDGSENHLALIVVIVQKSASSKVRAGENKGKQLSHVQVVRKISRIVLDGISDGKAEIEWPPSLNPDDMELTAFIQDQRTGSIYAVFNTELGLLGSK